MKSGGQGGEVVGYLLLRSQGLKEPLGAGSHGFIVMSLDPGQVINREVVSYPSMVKS